VSASESDVVFNVVWASTGFEFLIYFVASQMRQSGARFRFVANGCSPDEIMLMERFAARHADQVVEVVEVARDDMVTHGAALDLVHGLRDDGEYFSFIDPDIKARGPFLSTFLERLDEGCDAITSGRGVWTDDDRVPPGHPGVSGEYFYSQDGYLFGSPHFAIYRRRALDATLDRWETGFAAGGPDLAPAASERLVAAGHDYWKYDTGKIVNILFQEDGNRLCHQEHPQLLHIGGMSHYLSTDMFVRAVQARFEVAQFAAEMLRELCEGREAPVVPAYVEPGMEERLALVREELIDLVITYRPWVAADGG
jgi:hypothetical protein